MEDAGVLTAAGDCAGVGVGAGRRSPEGRLRILACAIEGKASTGEGGSRPWGLRRLREMERLANRLG